MYTVLLILAVSMVAGRLGREILPASLLRLLTMGAIFLLLFLLGLSIGANDELFSRLPELGWQAAVLAAAFIAGSIAASVALCHILRRLNKPLSD